MKEFIDNLTGLNNMLYLFENYNKYIKDNPKTYLVSVDFQKLKYVNDNFGHAVGDICIMTFANLLRVYFTNSLLIRRSGDEFVVITTFEPEEIIRNFTNVSRGIELAFEKKILPIAFKFNCGIKKSDFDLKETLFKADITMYVAKKASKMIEYYRDEYLLSLKDREMFVQKIDCLVENKSFTYVKQGIFNTDKTSADIFEIYTRDEEGNKLFDVNNIDSIRMNYRIKRIDLVNLETVLSSNINSKFILDLNYHTLISHEYSFVEHINKIVENSNIKKENICLSIDFLDCYDSYDELILIMKELIKAGYSLCIQGLNFESKISLLPILATVKISYVKVSKDLLEKAMIDRQTNIMLQYMVKMIITLGARPLFKNIEKEEEYRFIKAIDERCLIKGYYFEKETKLEM